MSGQIKTKPLNMENMKNEKQDSVQKLLYKTFKPALGILRLIGYFPHSISKHYEVTNCFCSVPFFWSLFVLFILLLGNMQLYLKQDWMFKTGEATTTATERFCKVLLAWTFMLAASTLGAKGLLSIKATKKFWNLNYVKLEELGQINPHFDLTSTGFQPLRKKITRITLIWTSLAVSFCALIVGVATTQAQITPLVRVLGMSRDLNNDTSAEKQAPTSTPGTILLLPVVMVVIFFVAYLYITMSVYMTCFLQLYDACLKIIVAQLQEATGKFPGNHPYAIKIDRTMKHRDITFTRKVRDCIRAYYVITDLTAAFSHQFTVEITIVVLVSLITILVSAFFAMYTGLNDWMNIMIPFIRIGIFVTHLYAITTVSSRLTSRADEFRQELVRIDMDMVSTSMQTQVTCKNYGFICGIDGTYL